MLATYAPSPAARNPRQSRYLTLLQEQQTVTTDRRKIPEVARYGARRLEPQQPLGQRAIRLTFSQLFLYWVCPRAFYLRFLIGIPPPVAVEIGYGQSLHNAAKEVHQRVQHGELLSTDDLATIAESHFCLPFAGNELSHDLRRAAISALTTYYNGYIVEENSIVTYIEKEVRADFGMITVLGRIDLVTESENKDTAIAELKTESGAINEDELYAYSLGFEATTGKMPKTVETRIIRADAVDSEPMACKPTHIDQETAKKVRDRIASDGHRMIRGHFPIPLTVTPTTCAKCDVRRLCWHWQKQESSN